MLPRAPFQSSLSLIFISDLLPFELSKAENHFQKAEIDRSFIVRKQKKAEDVAGLIHIPIYHNGNLHSQDCISDPGFSKRKIWANLM
jgi:hypothetical protein